MKKGITSILLCLIFQTLYSQNADKEIQEIEASIATYFLKERENIHVHFSKDVYFLEEQISFKGYVYNQQNQQLFTSTTNVFLEVFDDQKKLILRKLFFANQGVFEHNVELDQSLESGKYYFRFYTNYMNNFSEDLSSTYVLNIVNPNEPSFAFKNKGDLSNINIAVYPESGVFLSEIQNRFSVKVTDCFGNGLEVKNAKVLDKEQREVVTFYTNKYGYGNFDIFGSDLQDYTILIDVEGKISVENLPKISYSGISLMVNTYSFTDKTHFKIRSKNVDNTKNYFLVINQNGKSVVNKVDFKEKAEWTFLIENEVLFHGVNTARLLDQDLNLLSERLFFINKRENRTLSIKKNINQQNQTGLLGKAENNLALMSTSVLPGNSKSFNSGRNIINSLLINPYSSEVNPYDLDYYIENTKNKNFDIDLFFMHQKSKINWNNIQLKNLPSSLYSFDNGISLKGKVYQEISNRNDYIIQLFSIEAALNEFAKINETNEFEFKNLILADSTWVQFRLMDINRKPIVLKTNIRVLDSNKAFNKTLNVYKSDYCRSQIDVVTYKQDDFPVFKDAIALKEVEVKSRQKARQENLTKVDERENVYLKGYKGSDLVSFRDMMLIDFLKSKGFGVVNINGEEKITSSLAIVSGYIRTTEERDQATGRGGSLNGQPTYPQIMIDDFEQMTHEFLISLRMTQIDEIYFDRRVTIGMASSAKGYAGMIKVYTKVPVSLLSENFTLPFQIKNGFSKNFKFKNNRYLSHSGNGFENYGLVYWNSSVVMDENGLFEINTPLLNQESVDVFVEGVSLDGTLILERKRIEVE